MKKKSLCKIWLVPILLVILTITSSTEASRFNMSYLYGNYDYTNLVARTNHSLDEVSPSYFDLYASGNLKFEGNDLWDIEVSFIYKNTYFNTYISKDEYRQYKDEFFGGVNVFCRNRTGNRKKN